MTEELVSQKYKKIQDVHGLPHLSRLTETFGFDLEGDEEIMEQIREEVSDKIFSFSEKIIEPIIIGMDSYSSWFEQEMVDDKEKGKLFDLYRKIQALKWENNLLSMKNDEAKSADWIKKTWELWNGELETTLVALCESLSKGWSELKVEKSKKNYFG